VLRLSGRRVLVVGGGAVAARKAQGLLAADADVTVVAPNLSPEMDALRPAVAVEQRAYRAGEAAEFRLVVTATDDAAVQQRVYDDAEAAGVWVNAADDPERCSFTLPAIVRNGPVVVAVSTQGASPALASGLRDRIAAALPPDVDAVAAELSRRRRDLRDRGISTESVDWSGQVAALLGEGPGEPNGPA
jgi:precorrin-2 dehydrogenase/sirohydrochlorin ferrochelatase